MADSCSGGVCNYGGNGGGVNAPTGIDRLRADVVRSGNAPAWLTKNITSSQLKSLGRAGYMQLYPEVFGGSGGYHLPYSLRRGAYQREQIKNYEAMMREYTGPEGTYMRWILKEKINKLKLLEGSIRGLNVRDQSEPMPIPDWMQPFVTTTTTQPEILGARRPRKSQLEPKTTYGLRPLGAQAELNTEQMMQMAGFLSAQKGWDLQSKSDLGRFWEPYTRESESMFPQATRQAPRWATAQQR